MDDKDFEILAEILLKHRITDVRIDADALTIDIEFTDPQGVYQFDRFILDADEDGGCIM